MFSKIVSMLLYVNMCLANDSSLLPSERALPLDLLLLDLLQQWGARRPEVSFYLRHCPPWTQGAATQTHTHGLLLASHG